MKFDSLRADAAIASSERRRIAGNTAIRNPRYSPVTRQTTAVNIGLYHDIMASVPATMRPSTTLSITLDVMNSLIALREPKRDTTSPMWRD